MREFFFLYGEERDLTIRLMQAGYRIEYASTSPIVHCYSPKRSADAQNRYAVRNTLLFDCLNIPQPFVVPRLVWHALRLFLFDLTWANIWRRMTYVASGFGGCLRFWRLRKPVDRITYANYCRLPAHGAVAWTSGDDVPAPCMRACLANQRP